MEPKTWKAAAWLLWRTRTGGDARSGAIKDPSVKEQEKN